MGVVIGITGPLRVAAISTAVSVVIGLWLAWLLVNRRFPGRRELGWVATAALALPAPVICYWLLVQGRGTALGMAGAAVLSAAPLLVRAGRTALTSVDPVYGNTARSLGASDWRIFWRIEFPQVWRPAAAATTVAFARVFGEFVVAAVFIGVHSA